MTIFYLKIITLFNEIFGKKKSMLHTIDLFFQNFIANPTFVNRIIG